MKKTLRNTIGLILALCLAVSCMVLPASAYYTGTLGNFGRDVVYTPGQFSDVPADKWYGDSREQTVRLVYELGLMDGVGGGAFAPEAPVTLASAITMAVRVNRIYFGDTAPMAVTDPWYQAYVDYAVDAGIIYEDDFYDYNAYATRAEMAYIFAWALPDAEYPAIRQVDALPDVAWEVTPYSDCIFFLYNAGIISGNDEYGTFAPDSTIQRAAAAAIISRIALPSQRSAEPLKTVEEKPPVTDPEPVGASWSEYYTYGMELTEANKDEMAVAAFRSLANGFTIKTLLPLQSTFDELNQKYCPYAGSMSWGYWDEGGYQWATLTINYSLFARLMAYLGNPSVVSADAEVLRYNALADNLLYSIITDGMTDYEKSKAIHDYMVANYYYDTNYTSYAQNSPQDIACHSFSGLLDSGTAVCQGYSELYALLMQKCGITSKVIVGRAGGDDHSWNLIKLDGDWYHVDATWDDPTPDRPGRVKWDYFCITDNEMDNDHSWERDDWPAAVGTKY